MRHCGREILIAPVRYPVEAPAFRDKTERSIGQAMTRDELSILSTFPPRPLRPDEIEIVNQWRDSIGDTVNASVNERRGDDPRYHRKIVITVGHSSTPTHLIHTGRDVVVWILQDLRTGRLRSFGLLREALDAVFRPMENRDDPGRADYRKVGGGQLRV